MKLTPGDGHSPQQAHRDTSCRPGHGERGGSSKASGCVPNVKSRDRTREWSDGARTSLPLL